MIEWNIFYRMLGIPEDITEPTYYHLLGLHPKTCSVELVERMLHKQRNRLRQNIPGPQFIPLVLKFEKEKLERAAEVLRDPQIREKYNKYLRQKSHIKKREKQKGIAKKRLLKKARDIINSLLSPDKTLDDSKRPILIARLKELGIKESRINSLLERIPRPAEAVSMPGDEAMEYFTTAVDLAIGGNLLTQDAELKILELANKLNIDETQAINKVDQILEERNAQRGESDVSLLKREFENRVLTMVPNGLATQDQYRLLMALAGADNVPDTIAREVLNRCLKIVTDTGSAHEEEEYLDLSGYVCEKEPVGILVTEEEPDEIEQVPATSKKSLLRRNLLPISLISAAVVIGIFIVSASLFMMGQGKDSPQSKPPEPEKASSKTQIVANTKLPPVPNTDAERQRYISEKLKTRSNPQTRSRTTRNFSPTIEPDNLPPSEPNPRFQSPPIIHAADVRNIYSPSTRKNELLRDPVIMHELLTDLALTMRLCYHNVSSFTAGSAVPNGELQRLLKMSKSELMENLAGQVADPETMSPVATLTNSSTSVSNSRKSAEELLSSIKDKSNRIRRRRALIPPQQMIQKLVPIYRDLYQLSKLSDPGIRQNLRKMINGKELQEVDIAIALTLDRISGSPSPPTLNRRSRRSSSSRSMRTTPSPPKIPVIEKSAWEPDSKTIKLLAVTAHYAELTAIQLKNRQDTNRISAAGYRRSRRSAKISCSPSEVGKNLLDELDTITKQLTLLTAEHPDEQSGNKATIETNHPYDHKTVLQKAAVEFKAIGDLLALLIQQSELGNEAGNNAEQIYSEWEQSISTNDNIVHELRENCYYNLRLWEILAEHNVNLTIMSREDNGQPSNPINSSTSQELDKKYNQKEQQRHEALSNLSKGLNAYINSQFTTAVQELSKALESRYVVVLADSVRLIDLKDIRDECEKKAKNISTCKKCNGTKLEACNMCFGSGIARWCPQCGGEDLVRKTLSGSSLCRICSGKGYIRECRECNGEGFKECTHCSVEVGITSNKKQAIKELIAKADYLNSGGLDFFTSEALEPSPRLQP